MIELRDIRGNLIELGDKLIRPIGGVHLMETKLIRYTPKGYYFSRPKMIITKAPPSVVNLSGNIYDYTQYRNADLQTEQIYMHHKEINDDMFLIIEKNKN